MADSNTTSQPDHLGNPNRSEYVYTSLYYADSIRLFDLLPGRKGDPLACIVRDVRKAENPEYEALSYAWGESLFSQCIEEVATSTKIRVTENLYEALQVLRLQDTTRDYVDRCDLHQSIKPEGKGSSGSTYGSGVLGCSKGCGLAWESKCQAGIDDPPESRRSQS